MATHELKKISLRKALSFAWSTYFNHFFHFFKISFAYLLWIALAFIGLLTILILFKTNLNVTLDASAGLLAIIIFLMDEFFSVAILKSGFSFFHNPSKIPAGEWDIFSQKTYRFITARILYILALGLGFIALIIPGFYIYYKYYFSGFSILEYDKSLSADRTINAHATSRAPWKLLFYQFLISFSKAFFSAGLITAIFLPFVELTKMHIYKQLTDDNQ